MDTCAQSSSNITCTLYISYAHWPIWSVSPETCDVSDFHCSVANTSVGTLYGGMVIHTPVFCSGLFLSETSR